MFEDKEEKHPSFGQMSFTRVQCSHGQTLYGSDLQHNTVIKMELKRSVKRRGLNHDWYFGNETVASCSMSQNQFSELITSMNMGDGIPVTLEFTQEDGRIDPPDFSSKVDLHEEEFKDMTKRVGAELIDLKNTMEELLSGSGTVKKEDRNIMLKKVQKAVQDLVSNMPYVEECFKESMDKVVTDAKGTIEAFYQHRVTEAGVKALAEMDGVEAPKLITRGDKDE